MGSRRRGEKDIFWNAATVSSGDVSTAIQTGRDADNFAIYIQTSGASAFQVQVAHIGDQTADGVLPDPDAQNFVWHDLWYLGNSGQGNSTPITLTFSGAGALATLIPDYEPDWTRLKCTSGSSVTVTAGFELQGD